MKQITLIVLTVFFFFSCSDNFDLEKPDAKKFVKQLKNGTYNEFALAENGEKLWTLFPKFSMKDIPILLSLADDTTIINPFKHFPTNPISSIPPFRIDEKGNGEGIMLAEYLLWSVETIINNGDYPSLTPLLRQGKEPQLSVGLTGKDVLAVREKYLNWWNDYGKNGNISVSPLSGTGYWWR